MATPIVEDLIEINETKAAEWLRVQGSNPTLAVTVAGLIAATAASVVQVATTGTPSSTSDVVLLFAVLSLLSSLLTICLGVINMHLLQSPSAHTALSLPTVINLKMHPKDAPNAYAAEFNFEKFKTYYKSSNYKLSCDRALLEDEEDFRKRLGFMQIATQPKASGWVPFPFSHFKREKTLNKAKDPGKEEASEEDTLVPPVITTSVGYASTLHENVAMKARSLGNAGWISLGLSLIFLTTALQTILVARIFQTEGGSRICSICSVALVAAALVGIFLVIMFYLSKKQPYGDIDFMMAWRARLEEFQNLQSTKSEDFSVKQREVLEKQKSQLQEQSGSGNA